MGREREGNSLNPRNIEMCAQWYYTSCCTKTLRKHYENNSRNAIYLRSHYAWRWFLPIGGVFFPLLFSLFLFFVLSHQINECEIIGSSRANSRALVGLSRGRDVRTAALCWATRKIRTRVPFNRTSCRDLRAKKEEWERERGRYREWEREGDSERRALQKKIREKSYAIKSEN